MCAPRSTSTCNGPPCRSELTAHCASTQVLGTLGSTLEYHPLPTTTTCQPRLSPRPAFLLGGPAHTWHSGAICSTVWSVAVGSSEAMRGDPLWVLVRHVANTLQAFGRADLSCSSFATAHSEFSHVRRTAAAMYGKEVLHALLLQTCSKLHPASQTCRT